MGDPIGMAEKGDAERAVLKRRAGARGGLLRVERGEALAIVGKRDLFLVIFDLHNGSLFRRGEARSVGVREEAGRDKGVHVAGCVDSSI